MSKKTIQLLVGLITLLPAIAFAQADDRGHDNGGPMFDKWGSTGYGNEKVLVCYQESERMVPAARAQKLFELGATPGKCQPHGTLIITKTTTGGDGTFKFTTTNGNLADFKIATQNGTGSVTLSLAYGSYVINEIPQKDWKNTSNTCTVNIVSGQTSTCTVTNEKIELPGSISGTVYKDPSGKGKDFQSFWNRFSGVTVYLDTNNNGKLDGGETATVSNFFGKYSFGNLPPNVTYHVREVVPVGYKLTYPRNGRYNEPIKSGQNEGYDDFGNYKENIGRGGHWYDRFFGRG